jgi:hypothetical protein
MNARQLENLILLLMVLGLVIAIWVIIYHPEWLLWLFTYKG